MTRWRPGRSSRGWQWYARVRGSRARTPRCCCRSYSRPRRRPRSAVRTTRVYADITRDTSTVSARRRRMRIPDVVPTTKAPSTRCSKPCPNDKNQANDGKLRFGHGYGGPPVIRTPGIISISSPPWEYKRRFLIYSETVLLHLLLCLVPLAYTFSCSRSFVRIIGGLLY